MAYIVAFSYKYPLDLSLTHTHTHTILLCDSTHILFFHSTPNSVLGSIDYFTKLNIPVALTVSSSTSKLQFSSGYFFQFSNILLKEVDIIFFSCGLTNTEKRDFSMSFALMQPNIHQGLVAYSIQEENDQLVT